MKAFIIIVACVVVLLFVPLRIKVKVNFDFLQNVGFSSGYFFNLRLFLFQMKLAPNKLNFTGKRKNFSITLFDFGGKKSFAEKYFSTLVARLRFKHIRVLSHVGFEDNCMLSCLACGGLNALAGAAAGVMTVGQNVPIEINNFPDFLKKNLICAFSSSVDVTLFKVICAFAITISKK